MPYIVIMCVTDFITFKAPFSWSKALPTILDCVFFSTTGKYFAVTDFRVKNFLSPFVKARQISHAL